MFALFADYSEAADRLVLLNVNELKVWEKLVFSIKMSSRNNRGKLLIYKTVGNVGIVGCL